MGIALPLEQYLDGRGVPYEVRTHERTLRSSETAQASVIPENNLAKGVLIKRKDGHLLAIVPASCHVNLKALGAWIEQPIALATSGRHLRRLRLWLRPTRRRGLWTTGRDRRQAWGRQ
jgi:Ala-tRNA(Pro) deacylase